MYCELDRLHALLAKCTVTSEVTINTAPGKDGWARTLLHSRCCIALHCTCTCLARCGSGRVRPLRRPASGRPFSILAVPGVCCFCCSVESGRRPFIATLPLAAPRPRMAASSSIRARYFYTNVSEHGKGQMFGRAVTGRHECTWNL